MEPFQEKGGSAANRHDKRGDMHTDSQTYEGGRVGTQAKVKERERREQHTQGHTRPNERNGERRGRVEIRKRRSDGGEKKLGLPTSLRPKGRSCRVEQKHLKATSPCSRIQQREKAPPGSKSDRLLVRRRRIGVGARGGAMGRRINTLRSAT